MGSDNLFRKRKAKTAQELDRRKAKRAPYDKVLIVCEGEKTEPQYFIGLKNHYELNGANVEITGDCGSAPKSIVEYAKQRYREEKDAGDPFNRVYCVFDKDTHPTYAEALGLIASAKPNETFSAVTSVPSFEYWLLLHFVYTTMPYQARLGDSAGDQVLRDLKTYMPDYEKGAKDVFVTLVGQLENAKANAKRGLRHAEAAGMDNPTTKVHELVEYLQILKKPK